MYAIVPFIVLISVIGGLSLIAWRVASKKKHTSQKMVGAVTGRSDEITFSFENRTGKTIDLELVRAKGFSNIWAYNIKNGETLIFNLETRKSVACDKLSLSVYEYQKSRADGWMYNWSPECKYLMMQPGPYYNFIIEVDRLETRDNMYKINWKV